MKLILSHPTGNANVRAVAGSLVDSHMLHEFHTTVAALPGSYLYQFGGLRPFAELRKRSYDIKLRHYTRCDPFPEIGRVLAGKLGWQQLLRHEKGIFSIDAIYRRLDRKVAARIRQVGNNIVNGVYAYEDGALQSFRQAKAMGLNCFYDLPIGYWRTARMLLQDERERWPEWFDTISGFADSQEKLQWKDEELRLSDRIFVASSFTAQSLKTFPGQLAPIEVIPYGFPFAAAQSFTKNYSPGRKLKLLFVGSLSQRKGIADVFAVADQLHKHVLLTVVGRKVYHHCTALNRALSRHKWIPALPYEQVLELMRQHDVLVFPSLFEGFGLVITEAMSQGRPVITTGRTVGPDVIENGRNGWLIEAGSTEALKHAVENILRQPSCVESAGWEALDTARQRSWGRYGAELSSAIRHHLRS